MATRILWDEHEEAILLKALIDVLNHKIERKQTISEVSLQLRNLAKARRIEIDDKFRNENGISLQMNCLEYAYTEGKSGLYVTRGWYFDIVWKYKNDRNSFDKLLQEAKVMSAASNDNKVNFQKWLESADFGEAVSFTMSTFGMIDVLLHKNKVINYRIMEIDDPDNISILIDDIKNSKGIRLHSKRTRSAVIKGLSAYKDFLEHKDTKGEETASEEQSDKAQIVSFKDKIDYAYTRPVSLTYFSNKCVVKKWNLLYVQVVKYLFKDYSDKIFALVGKNIGKHGRIDLADAGGSAEMIAPKEVAEGLYLETNCSATSIVNKIRQLMDICDIDYSSIVIEYIFKNALDNESTSPASEAIQQEELARIKATLKLPRFEYGFKDDGVELYRFRASYEEVNECKCNLQNDELLNAIRNMGFEFCGKVYLIAEDSMNALVKEISGYKDQGTNIIYYEQIYDLNANKYFEEKIVSADMLKALLKHLMPEFKYKANYLALSSEKQTELELICNDIIRVWGNDTLQTFDELSLKLPLIPIDKIKFALSQQPAFVRNYAKTYLQADWFNTDEQEIKRLIDYIEEECEEHGKASIDEIPFDNLKATNPDFSDTALVTCFCKLVDNRFERSARILTRKGASKDTYTAVIEFCRRQDKCTYEELKRIARKVAGTIYQPDIIEAANKTMVRIDKDYFIADSLIRFDTDKIDTALDYIVTDDFIGLREITTFSTFPFCGYGWNLFLLESYCRRFSKKYKYDTRRANSSNSGAIVAKKCHLAYHDIMARAVARSGRELNQEEVFDLLTEEGYMERRRYSDIDLLINDASELRERR